MPKKEFSEFQQKLIAAHAVAMAAEHIGGSAKLLTQVFREESDAMYMAGEMIVRGWARGIDPLAPKVAMVRLMVYERQYRRKALAFFVTLLLLLTLVIGLVY